MKIVNTDTTVVSTITGDSYAMTFDKEGMAHLMSLLSNLYGNAPLAIIREYSANALDSHVSAGNTDPIIVTLPNEYDPNFVVQDFGLGLSEEDIINVYALYGKSTKTDSNEQIGALGIGAKSAFTVSSQFVVTGVKDGIKTNALFSLDKDGYPTVTILSSKPVDEPNGVRVSIPISQDYHLYQNNAAKFFSTWKPGTVLVDGKEPDLAYHNGIAIGDGLYVKNQNSISPIILVMGGIGYPVTKSLLTSVANKVGEDYILTKDRCFNGNIKLIADIEIGEVDITPSRENLRDTFRTQDTIVRIIRKYHDAAVKYIQQQLTSADNAMDAILKIRELKHLVADKRNSYTWNGIDLTTITLNIKYTKLDYGSSNSRIARVFDDIHLDPIKINFSDYLVITEVSIGKEESIRRLCTKYLLETDYKYIIFAPDKSRLIEWFNYGITNHIQTMTISEFKESHKHLRHYFSRRTGVTYNTLIDGIRHYKTPGELNKLGKPILWRQANDRKIENSSLFREATKDYAIVSLTSRQSVDSFVKRVPTAKRQNDILHKIAHDVYDMITPEEFMILNFKESALLDGVIQISDYMKNDDLFGNDLQLYKKAKALTGQTIHDLGNKRIAINYLNKQPTTIFSEIESQILERFPLLQNHEFVKAWKPKVLGATELKHLSIYIKAVVEQGG